MAFEFFKETWKNKDLSIFIVLVRFIIGIEWFMAGLDKIISGDFVTNISGTLFYFANGPNPPTTFNPNTWYVNLINNVFVPNSTVFGYLVMIGEFTLGIVLILGILVNLSSIISIFMSLNFLFAAGWLSESTMSVNWILAVLALILLLSPGAKTLSIDKLVANRFPKLNRFLIDWFGFQKLLQK